MFTKFITIVKYLSANHRINKGVFSFIKLIIKIPYKPCKAEAVRTTSAPPAEIRACRRICKKKCYIQSPIMTYEKFTRISKKLIFLFARCLKTNITTLLIPTLVLILLLTAPN